METGFTQTRCIILLEEFRIVEFGSPSGTTLRSHFFNNMMHQREGGAKVCVGAVYRVDRSSV